MIITDYKDLLPGDIVAFPYNHPVEYLRGQQVVVVATSKKANSCAVVEEADGSYRYVNNDNSPFTFISRPAAKLTPRDIVMTFNQVSQRDIRDVITFNQVLQRANDAEAALAELKKDPRLQVPLNNPDKPLNG